MSRETAGRPVNICVVQLRRGQGMLRRDGKFRIMFFIEAKSGKGWLPLGDENGIQAWRTAAARDAELGRLRDEQKAALAVEVFDLEKLRKKYGHEHPKHPRSDWKYLVNNDEVSRGYWEWLWFEILEEGRNDAHDT